MKYAKHHAYKADAEAFFGGGIFEFLMEMEKKYQPTENTVPFAELQPKNYMDKKPFNFT
jgi:hypothetical protein